MLPGLPRNQDIFSNNASWGLPRASFTKKQLLILERQTF